MARADGNKSAATPPVLVDRWGIEHDWSPELTTFAERKAEAYVVVFLGTECPVVTRLAPRLNELVERYAGEHVQFLGIYSSQGVTRLAMASHKQRLDLAMPVFQDLNGHLARRLEARVTPEAFLLTPDFQVVYRGLVDDSGWKKTPAPGATHYLAEAIDGYLQAVRSGAKSFALKTTRAQGCELQLPPAEPSLPERALTYFDDVAPIVNQHCVVCHYQGGIGGFPLDSFAALEAKASTVRREVLHQRMPPWQSDPKRGRPVHGVILLENGQRQMIVDWIDQGLARQKAGESNWLAKGTEPAGGVPMPPLPRNGEWTIGGGRPDFVLSMPRPFTLRPSETLEYQYFWVPNNAREDHYIQEVELLPGDRRVVHHMQVFLVEQVGRPKDLTKPLSGALMMSKLNGLSGENHWRIASFVPGDQMSTRRFPTDYGIHVPAGYDVVFEMHYTPIEETVQDRSSVGFVWRKEPGRPKHVVYDHLFYRNKSIEIAPHASHVRTEFMPYFKQSVVVLDVRPHMHLRGADYQVSAVYADGREELLVVVPAYDFNWQRRYVFQEPVKLPAGSTLKVVGHWDNSRMHPYNPDPGATVFFGEGSADEMSNLVVTYMIDEEAEQKANRKVSTPIVK